MSKRSLLILGLVLIIIACAAYWMIHLKMEKQRAAADALTEIVPVERRDLSETVEGDGAVAFSKNGGIYPAYSATVRKIFCQAGTKVKKGDLLMVLDSESLKSDWVEAENNYQKAKLNLSLAEKALERQKILYKAQGTTIDELESAENTVDLDREELKAAKAKLELLRQTSDEANFIGSDHRTIMIRAPFDGEIAWVEVKPGQTVSAIGSNSSDSSSNNLLLYLVADNSLEVEATVDEGDIDKVKRGQKAKVLLNNARQSEVTGVVTEVGSYGTDDSGVIVFPVKIRLNAANVTIRPEMTADVSIYVTSNPNVLAIPVKAVLDIRGKTMVKKWNGKTAELTEVELGVKSNSYVEVRSGLREGDRIVISQKPAAIKNSIEKQDLRNRGMMGPPPM